MQRIQRSLAALLLAAALPTTAAAPGEMTRGDRKGDVKASTDVTLVEVPVWVAGKDGHPVRGLTKDDFELYDEGKRVDTWDLEVIDLEDFARKTVTPDVSLPPAAQRHFLFLFDLSFSQPLNIAKARSAALAFAKNGMKNGDLGAVATVDVEKGLKLVLSFTPDHDQIVTALTTLGLPSLTQPTADPLSLTVYLPTPGSAVALSPIRSAGAGSPDAEFADILSAFTQMQEKVFDTYVQGRVRSLSRFLSDLARTLNSVRGRKNVVLFSEGFDSKLLSGLTGPNAGQVEGDRIVSGELWRVESEDRYGRSEVRQAMDKMYEIFRKTDTVIHAVDVSGLTTGITAEGITSGDTATSNNRLGSRGRGRDTLYAMSSETGGELFKNSNEVGEHLARLQEETALVYLLTYSPPDLKDPGRYHTLKVKVKASGVHPSFRAGYYEPTAYSKLTPVERRLLAAQQIAYGLPRSDIPASALATPLLAEGRDGALVPVIIEIPGAPLVKNAVGDALNVEIYAYATNQALKIKDFLSQTVSLDLERVGKQLAATGIKFYGELFLPPGTYWLKILIRIAETGRSGLLIVPVTVPTAENRQLFALAPLFHDPPANWVMVKAVPRPNAPRRPAYPFVSNGESFIPSAGPVLDPLENTDLSVFLYNAPDGGDFEVSGEIRGKGGVRLGPAAIRKVGVSRAGARAPLNVLCSFTPERLEKGSYTLWVSVKDRSSGAEGETLGFFEVR
ncbi:MAG TPA: VWA domain-containing protein [Thermoanaerobaculia bacterium]|nr:VWA domain-containing protein [Thermoanaerobaculia bacterium]